MSILTPIAALACQIDGGKNTTSGNLNLSYKIIDAPVAVSKPFSMEIKLCQADTPITPKQLRVDADMPAHGHGMNYQTTITELDVGHYQVDGFVFHMMGDWAFSVDVFTAKEKQSFNIDYTL